MMPHEAEKIARNRKVYWQRARRLTAILIAIWFLTTFGIIFFARELSVFAIFGWPLPFYMAAQGLTLIYIVIVAVYAICMQRLDRIMKDETIDAK